MTAHAARTLAITVRLMEGRYHGEPEWPPSPARLFQALVAGSSTTCELTEDSVATLRWLEARPPPTIAAPTARSGQPVKLWVPNNDLDAEGGDPANVPGIRTIKRVRPRLFDAAIPLVYLWDMEWPGDEASALRAGDLARGLYQLGRGVDMAWASAEILDCPGLDAFLGAYPGRVLRPTAGTCSGGLALPCPQPGSLDSLVVRHHSTLGRFTFEGVGRERIQVFQQAPKASFRQVSYNSPPHRVLFDLRPPGDMASFVSTQQSHASLLVEAIRDAAAARLAEALPASVPDIERVLVGRRVEGHPNPLPSDRIRLLPLASIGHAMVDRGIRRLLVEVPTGASLRHDDVFWAFSGLSVQNPTGAEIVVTKAADDSMLLHYGIDAERGARTWRTVTPAALPEAAARRRIDPNRITEEAKGAAERVQEESRAASAVMQALRHVQVHAPVEQVRVQREPFEAKGSRAEAFAPGTRFAKERLWHVEIVFREPVVGPLVIGDGRFLGLGIMAPAGWRAGAGRLR